MTYVPSLRILSTDWVITVGPGKIIFESYSRDQHPVSKASYYNTRRDIAFPVFTFYLYYWVRKPTDSSPLPTDGTRLLNYLLTGEDKRILLTNMFSTRP